MDGYTALFGSILDSTVWMLDDKTRLVWITMLAKKNGKHTVMASVPGLAHAARVDVESCRKALKKFMEPDPDSSNKEYEGRRIEEIPGGWIILNGPKYDLMASDRRAYFRLMKAQQRAREAEAVINKVKHMPAAEAAYVAASDRGEEPAV